MELNLGEALLIKTIADATCRTVNAIKEELKTVGDLGLLAQVFIIGITPLFFFSSLLTFLV